MPTRPRVSIIQLELHTLKYFLLESHLKHPLSHFEVIKLVDLVLGISKFVSLATFYLDSMCYGATYIDSLFL